MNNPFETIDARLSNIENLLLDLKQVSQDNGNHQQAEQLLTIEQAGELINLSKPTIYGLVSKSGIPVCKKGKRLYFSKQELMEWVKAGRKKTVTEIEAEADNFLSKKRRAK